MESKYSVGYNYTNKEGLDVSVVEYRDRKDITVEFSIGGARKVTTGSYIKKGLPLHPTHNKPQVGQQYACHDGDVVEIVEVITGSRVRVKWLSDGHEKERDMRDVKKCINRHPTKNKPIPGQMFQTNNSGYVKVVEFRSAIDVLVQFEDGETSSVSAASLITGNVRHPYCGFVIGSKHKTNSGWEFTILEYKDAHNVKVRWQDGSESWQSSNDIRIGAIKPLMQPSVEGIGYFGIGEIKPYTMSEEEQKVHGYWQRMMSRCYNPYELNKSKGSSYRDVFVDDSWLNFQNFAKWALRYKAKTKDAFDWELDKDLLIPNNKVYFEDACSFIPQEINTFLLSQDTGKYYRGVNIIIPKTENSATGYVARCCTENGREYLGFFKTPEAAFEAYKKAKEAYAKRLAFKWKDKIDLRAYEALMNYAVEITD